MLKLPIVNWDKKEVGTVEVSPEVFEVTIREDILHEMVRWHRACSRRGTHKAKTRAEVSGGGKKPFRQKGTGRARQGSSRSPLLESGGVIHGPSARDYSYRLPKKIQRLGLKTTLSALYAKKNIFVIDKLEVKNAKTKEIATQLKKFGLKKAILSDRKKSILLDKAIKNIPLVQYQNSAGVNVYDLLKHEVLVCTKETLLDLQKRCGVAV